MFLRRPPGNWTVLRLLGPWPWYVPDAAGVALVLLVALDAPFWPRRRRERSPGEAAGRHPDGTGVDVDAPADLTA
jgi:hypothetical protein